MLSIILNPRFKKTYLEQKKFKSIYPRLINIAVTLLKKSLNEMKMIRGANEINSVQLIFPHEPYQPTIFLRMFAHFNADNETQDEIDIYLSDVGLVAALLVPQNKTKKQDGKEILIESS